MEDRTLQIFTEDQISNITKYGDALRGIHVRLLAEGYFLDDRRTWNIFKVCVMPYCSFEVECDD